MASYGSNVSDTNSPIGEDDMLAMLEFFLNSAEVQFDPTRAAQCLRAANREIPPTVACASRLRLSQAADAMGVQLLVQQLSIREAIDYVAHDSPLALYAVLPDGSAHWFILGEASGRYAKLYKPGVSNGAKMPWYTAEELCDQLGIEDPDAVLEWLSPLPAAPMSEASRTSHFVDHGEGHDDNGHGHGHDDHAHAHLPPFQRLLGLLKPETNELWLLFLFAVCVGFLSLATPVVAMAVVNTVALGTLVQQLLVLCVGLFVALSLAAVLTFLQTVVVEFMQRRVFVRVAADLAYRLPRVDVREFDRQHGPELVNRFFSVLTVQKAAATLLLDGINLALQILIGLVLLGFYHVYLLGFDLVLIMSLIFLFAVLGRGAVRTAIQESIAKYRVAGWMEEVARHPVAFKGAGGPQFAMEQTDKHTRFYLKSRSAHFRVLMRQIGFALFLQVAANVALLAIGGFLVISGELTLGELVAAEIVVTLVVATFAKLGKQLEAFYELLAAVEKLGHLLDLRLERISGERHIARTRGAGILVHEVSFTYYGQHVPAISYLTLEINPGERVAITGPNGAGKSTLVDILFGLRHPDHGWVQIDGADLRTMQLDNLREHVAMVKGIEVIEGTVLENVRMGRDELTQADVRDAMRRVGLLETILALPKGLETMLWTGGAPLSLGQAKRLMLARAIVGQPRLLILDEALDHMDQNIRESILPALMGKDSHWTLVIVTHSEDVAKLCDRVIRLQHPTP